jgi:hypothetical protein
MGGVLDSTSVIVPSGAELENKDIVREIDAKIDGPAPNGEDICKDVPVEKSM